MLELTVSDVKQYVYCPRVVYFTYCVPVRRPTTYKMKEGQLEHEHTTELEQRRSLRAYGLASGEREFGVRLHSARLGLSGALDMLISTERERIPVEFKNSTGRLSLNHKYQLTGYALLVEEREGKPVRRAFVYHIPLKRSQEVTITPNMRRYAGHVLESIRDMVACERLPEPTRQAGRCVDCEFARFCGDRGCIS